MTDANRCEVCHGPTPVLYRELVPGTSRHMLRCRQCRELGGLPDVAAIRAPLSVPDLQALQAAMVGAPFTLAELAEAIVRSPKSMASVIRTGGAR